MAKIPLSLRLKKKMHADIASLQDEIVDILYSIDETIVLHGGTAIWRCYNGNRFSEDLDFFCKSIARIDKKFKEKLIERNLQILKLKKTSNLIFCKISDGNVEIRVEINFSIYKLPVVAQYEKADGTVIDVLTLTPEDIILKKLDAYKQRGFVRDIYDVYHLARYVKVDAEKKILPKIREFLKSPRTPIDEKNLKVLIYSGAIPSFKQIIEYLKRRFS